MSAQWAYELTPLLDGHRSQDTRTWLYMSIWPIVQIVFMLNEGQLGKVLWESGEGTAIVIVCDISAFEFLQKLWIVPNQRVIMMTSSNGNIFRVTGHLCGEFTGPRWIPRGTGEFPAQGPVTRSFDVFFDLRLSKQWWGWWYETPSCQLWRHRNVRGVTDKWLFCRSPIYH